MTFTNTLRTRLLTHVRTPLYRNAYALTFGAFATSGLGIVYWVLAARYYTAETVGLNAALISAMTFLSGVSRLNLDSVLFRFIPQSGSSTRKLIWYSYLISEVLAVLASIVFILGVNIWSPELNLINKSFLFGAWFVVATMLSSIFVLQDSVLTGLRRAIWIPIENTIFAISKIILLVAFANLYSQFGIFISWTIPATLLIVPVNYLIFRHLIPRHQQTLPSQETGIALKQIVKYVCGVFLGYLFLMISSTLLPLIVLQTVGKEASAYFYLPWMIGTSLQLVTTNMNISLTVEGAIDRVKLEFHTKRQLFHTAKLLALPIVVLFFGAPYVLRLFGAGYAIEGYWLLRFVVLATIPHMVNSSYIGFARVQHRIRGILFVQGATCILTLGLSSYLLSVYGITGVGIAWLTSQATVALVVLCTGFRRILLPRFKAI